MNIDGLYPFRVVSGFRPIGGLHIGHYGAVIKDIIAHQYMRKDAAFIFIADHHARSSWQEKMDFANVRPKSLDLTRQLVACGIDPKYAVIYRQSEIPEIFEVMWFIAGLVFDGALRHIVKNHQAANITGGIYMYPLLMVADIIATRATHVAIGDDQKQHFELARDIARKLAAAIGSEMCPLPELVTGEAKIVYGIKSTADKKAKMATESGNEIPLFATDDKVNDRIERIVTNSVSYGAPLPTEGCNILDYCKAIGDVADCNILIEKYGSGKFGYDDAKKFLRELFFERLGGVRKRYNAVSEGDAAEILSEGSRRARDQVGIFVEAMRSELHVTI